MKHAATKLFVSVLSAAFAVGMTIPTAAFASNEGIPEIGPESAIASDDSQLTSTVEVTTDAAAISSECTAVVKYYENPTFDDPDHPADAEGRVFLGQRVITGLHEGQVLNAWDYVVSIPGFFFFDGWPLELTVSANAADNVFTLTYFRTWNDSITVNYYLMEGADLTADNWKDALAPDDVHFIKMGSETFGNLAPGMTIDANIFESPIESTFTIDAYPESVTLALDPSENVINVLYAPTAGYLPDDVEIPDDSQQPPDDTIDKDEIVGTLPDDLPIDEGLIIGTDGTLMNAAQPAGSIEGNALAQTGDEAPWVIVVSIGLGALGIGALAFFMWRTRGTGHGGR